nr:hypothetical protein Itr_chr02CG09570 [Ipomoea trifida]
MPKFEQVTNSCEQKSILPIGRKEPCFSRVLIHGMRLKTVKALLYRMGFWCGHDRKRKRRGRMGLICSGGNVKVKVRVNGGGVKGERRKSTGRPTSIHRREDSEAGGRG